MVMQDLADWDRDPEDPDGGEGGEPRPLAQTLAELAAAMRGADRAIVEARSPIGRLPLPEERNVLIYDLDWDEDRRLALWRGVVAETSTLPPTLAAAIAADAWESIAPLEHAAWLGKLLTAALLRHRGKTRVHLACLHEGAQKLPYERRRARDPTERLAVHLEAIVAAAEAGLRAHDRCLLARAVMMKKLEGRRSSSRLPALLDYVLTRPIVSAAMIAQALRVTPRAAQNLVGELGLREATGRTRYRAWGL